LIEEEERKKTLWKILKRRTATWEDFQDAFMRALEELLIAIELLRFRKDGNVRAYVFQIAKNIWFKSGEKDKRSRKGPHIDAFYPEDEQELIPGMEDIDEERWKAGMEIFKKLSKRCRQLLLLAFLGGKTNSEIAIIMGYDSEKVVRVKKSKCLKRLGDLGGNNTE
jgi:RNA polymerase sigma factor (sigma-70 family)